MNKYLIAIPLLLLLIFSIINCDGNGNNSITQTVGPEGGTITSADGRLSLEIPPGALTEDTEITIILLLLPGEDGVNLLGYEFLPDGLEFLTPARVTVDVEEITGTPDEGETSFNVAPIILTTEGEGVVALGNLTLELDSNASTTTLSGDVEHFSRKLIGGNIPITATISGVPFQHPANTLIDQISVKVEDFIDDINQFITLVEYADSSIAPAIYKGVNPLKIPPVGLNADAILSYECGDPGLGTFQAEINVEISKEISEILDVEEIDIGAAFLFGAAREIIIDNLIETVRNVFIKDYKFNAKRDVLCFGPTPPPSNPPPSNPPPTDPPPTDPPPTDPPPTDPPPTDPPPTDPPPTDPPPTDPPEPTKNIGLYESASPLCGIGSFTLILTMGGNLSIAGFGANEGVVLFDETANPLNFDHPELDLEILGVDGHSCTIMCNQAGDQITLTCSRPGAMCTQTLTHSP